MSKTQKAQKLKGFQDIFGSEMVLKESLSKKIEERARLSNFVSVETPCIEYTDTLLGEGGDTDKQIYRFSDNGGRDVALRYDLTVPFARFVSEHHGKLALPYKRFQIGKAWRAEKPQKGRFREFSQVDFDIVGVNNFSSDVEIISLLFSVFSEVVGLPFSMKLGYRELVSLVIRKIYGPLSKSDEERVLINLDKIEKIGQEKVVSLIADETKTDKEKAKTLLSVLVSKENYSSQIKSLSLFLEGDADAKEHLVRLERTLDILSKISKSSLGSIVLDLSTVRGLAYYTGIVFETTLNDFSDFGSVCSGGRYDNLCDRFLKESLPGIGGSLGLDRLVAALSSLETKEIEEKNITMIAVADDEARDYAFEVLKLLRDQKIPSEVFLKDQKIPNQFKFASRHNYSFVVTVGEEEKKKRTVNVKDMKAQKEERDIELSSLVDSLKKV